jgi:hypothetical protein
MIPHLFAWLAGRRRPLKRARPRDYRPRLDCLEERLVPTLLKVALTVNGSVNTFTTLSQAVSLAQDGDTIEILPGSNPGPATVTQNNLAIIGDPNGGYQGQQAGGTLVPSIVLLGNNDTVGGLFIGTINIGIGATGQTISNCLFNGQGVTQTFGSAFSSPSDGNNSVVGCTFVNGANVTLGDSGGTSFDTSASDNISGNVFWNPVLYAIKVQNEIGGLVIANNRVTHTDPNTGLAFIEATDCIGTITGNTLTLNAAPGAIGILANDFALDAQTTGLTIANNVVTSNVTGISVQHFSTTDSFTVAVTNNALAGNLVGLGLTGNAGGTGSDYGALSISGNDFRGYTGVNGNFAIAAIEGPSSGGQAAATHLSALNNIFSVNVASIPSIISVPAGTVIDTSVQLTGGVATLTAMFQTLGGGPPTAAQIAAYSKLGPQFLATVAVTSSQAEATFVGNLYVTLLGRIGSAAEINAWVNLITSANLTQEQVIIGFATSAEYYNKVTFNSSNPTASWIQSLYVNLLGRLAAGTEINAWLGIAGSLGLAGVVQGFVSSAEFRSNQVAAFYGAGMVGAPYAPNLLKRRVPPSLAEINGWITAPRNLRTIEIQMLMSAEFAIDG